MAEETPGFKRFCGDSSANFKSVTRKRIVLKNGLFFFAALADDPKAAVAGAAVTLQNGVLCFHFYWSIRLGSDHFKPMLTAIESHYAPQKISFITFPVPKDWHNEIWEEYADPVPDKYGRPLTWFTFTYSDMMAFANFKPPPDSKEVA